MRWATDDGSVLIDDNPPWSPRVYRNQRTPRKLKKRMRRHGAGSWYCGSEVYELPSWTGHFRN